MTVPSTVSRTASIMQLTMLKMFRIVLRMTLVKMLAMWSDSTTESTTHTTQVDTRDVTMAGKA